MSGEDVPGDGRLVRRLDDAPRGRRDDGHGRRPRRRPPADRRPLGRGRSAQRPLLRAVPERARLAAPRLRRCCTRSGRARRAAPTSSASGSSSRRRSPRPAFDPSDAIDFWDTVNRQDWHVCELAQKGVGTTGLHAGPLLGRGVRRPRLRPDGRRALRSKALRGGGRVNADRGAARRGRPAGAASPSSPKRDWDAIVVGGGHNGLTAAAYLARAGQLGARARAPRAARRRLRPWSARSPTSASSSAPAPTSSACSTSW